VRHFPKGSLPLRPDVRGASYWAVALEHAMLTYFEVEPGARFERHAHESEQITLVLEGSLAFEFDDDRVAVGPGEVVAIPGNVSHAVTAGPAGARAVDAWSPVRPEYRERPAEGPTVEDEVARVAHAWDAAMITNDARAIGEYMTDDWTIVGPDGNVTAKETFLDLIRSGALTHDVMTSEELSVRVHGASALVVARGISGGTFHGRPFRVVERASCVFVRRDGAWKCALTHLSRLA
jgi:quercetin dioxygenase-like cupin family protein/ketosteroid isomerase-like protein